MGEEAQMEEGNSERETPKATTNEKSVVAETIPMEESHWGMRVRPLENEATPFIGENSDEEGIASAAATKEEAVIKARTLIKEAGKEEKTMKQFDEIRKLCSGENDFNKTATEKKLRGFVKNLCVGDTKLSTGRDEVGI